MKFVPGLKLSFCIHVNMEPFGNVGLYSTVFTCISQWFILHSLLSLFVAHRPEYFLQMLRKVLILLITSILPEADL